VNTFSHEFCDPFVATWMQYIMFGLFYY